MKVPRVCPGSKMRVAASRSTLKPRGIRPGRSTVPPRPLASHTHLESAYTLSSEQPMWTVPSTTVGDVFTPSRSGTPSGRDLKRRIRCCWAARNCFRYLSLTLRNRHCPGVPASPAGSVTVRQSCLRCALGCCWPQIFARPANEIRRSVHNVL